MKEESYFDNIFSIFKDCGISKEFLEKYIQNAILSYIEQKEQEKILAMKYNDWIEFDRDESIEKVIKYLKKLSIACREKDLNDEEINRIVDLVKNVLVNKYICMLYIRGIYDDGISRYILLKTDKGYVDDSSVDKCIDVLNNSNKLYVRSRFIEIARDLFHLKQRFEDKSVWEARPLVDRVFAYAEPRKLPLGKIKPEEILSDEEIKQIIKSTINSYIRYYSPYIQHIQRTKGIKIDEKDLYKQANELVNKILSEFLKAFPNDFKFYKFQVRGIKKILHNTVRALRNEGIGVFKGNYAVIEAPTGSGKTEIFVLSLIIVALIRNIILYLIDKEIGKNERDVYTPVGLIIYPRRALASNQLERLLRYLSWINKIILNQNIDESYQITLSMNYTEIRDKKEYIDAIQRCSEKVCKTHLKYGVKIKIDKERNEIQLFYFTCPNGGYPKLRILNGNDIDTSRIICNDEEYTFIRVTKQDVKEKPGDIHLTLFETIRQNLLAKSWRNLFGITKDDKNYGIVFHDGPLFIVLDEIHTYTFISGARYSFLLRRLLNRISRIVLTRKEGNRTRYEFKQINRGFVVIGVSATIPNKENFLKQVFQEKRLDVDDILITIADKETIPLGNEYFYIVVPTQKYLVNALSVTIQTIMNIFYNLPVYHDTKKAFIFIDNLDVVIRARKNIKDAIVDRRLQDLRNITHAYFRTTLVDYNDNIKLNDIPKPLTQVVEFNSWMDGELWWGYSLEAKGLGKQYNLGYTTSFDKIAVYTSKHKGSIYDANIIITTSSLEVGIDYSDVVLIHQHGVPPNISSLVQRAGRAGRIIMQNPLVRTAISVLLSPDNPRQSVLFEIFTRTKSLREALKYDTLMVSVDNHFVIEQTVAETVLDYIVNVKKKSKFSDINKLECNEYIKVIRYRHGQGGLVSYISPIFQNINLNIDDILEDILNDLEEKCQG